MKGTAGKTFLASINQVIVREGAGPDGKQRVRTRAVVHDLTTESEMRQALKASEDRFQRFFDEAPVGIILIDEEEKLQIVTPPSPASSKRRLIKSKDRPLTTSSMKKTATKSQARWAALKKASVLMPRSKFP